GPASIATRTASGGRFRKAAPSAMERMTGKPNVQKTALGSRKNIRKRARVSSTIAARGSRADSTGAGAVSRPPGSVTEPPPGERDEDVLERRAPSREAL